MTPETARKLHKRYDELIEGGDKSPESVLRAISTLIDELLNECEFSSDDIIWRASSGEQMLMRSKDVSDFADLLENLAG
jgi:hypothetical protein